MATVILHIDDRPELPDGLLEQLEREGYARIHTADPEEAIRLVEQRRPALVLMELEIESCDGLDLLMGIRASDRHAPPVLILSRAPRNSSLHGEAIAIGVTDFLSKPARASELMASIREIAPPAPKVETPTPAADLPAAAPKLETATPVADPPAPALAGALADTPVAELLARLRRRGASGVLRLERGETCVDIELRNGSSVAIDSNRPRPEAPGGVLSDEEVELENRQRAEALFVETLCWRNGDHRFFADRNLAPESALDLGRDPSELLLLGVLEAAPLDPLRERLAKRGSLYALASDECALRLEGARLTDRQRRALAELDGSDTVQELIESKELGERLLYGLWVSGAIELHAAPTLILTELLGTEESAPPLPAPESVRADPSKDDEDLEGVLRELAQRVMAGDDFEALGISVSASDAEVRSAYAQRLREIPERALSGSDARRSHLAERIRQRIELAYAHLKDQEKRHAYALLCQELDQDDDAKRMAERALEGERWFRKGKALLERRSHAEATEAFGMASHLDPNEGEYVACLGYALYLSNPGNKVVQREAMEHVANGIKRSPNAVLGYVYLGRMFAAKDDLGAAKKLFRRALRIKPDFHPALQEMRLLEMRERKAGGVLSRLFGR